MLNKEILNTLKKHLKDIEGTDFESIGATHSKNKILKFGEDIKSANEFIGALQVLDITIRKIIAEARKIDTELLEDAVQLNCTTFNIEQLIQKCSFMGKGLFDVTMATTMGDCEIELEVASPLNFALQKDFDSLIQYLEDKREEIKQKLALISQNISNSKKEDNAYHQDFSQDFKAKDFLKMF
ncbi:MULTISPECIES: flagellar FLiS export co-chaperone [unclassified Helicobacter]|uniref:flagellar FLiS export co-chaperone n=1 Tax=unclassified Helicobacter TaxID=2593540 RepID=UPI0013154FB5|nr:MULTISPECIES: flagellar FLiS export co-chaperone [unclassified Helicobacter]